MIFSALLLSLAVTAVADDSAAPTVEVSPAPTTGVSPAGSRATMKSRSKRPRNTARDHRAMPPAGSAATGGTSSSPGGAPRPFYGEPN